MMRSSLLTVLLFATPAPAAGSHHKTQTLDIGGRLELMVDDYLIDSMTGDVRLELQTPTSGGKVLDFDKPWEGTTCFYVSVIRGDGLYRLYYRGHSDPSYAVPSLLEPGETMIPRHHEVTCYAESRDGRTWTKPSLGLVEFDGTKGNNIIWDGFGNHNFMVFLDTNPKTPPTERYKALASGGPNRPLKRMVGMVRLTASTGNRSARSPSSRTFRRIGEATRFSGTGSGTNTPLISASGIRAVTMVPASAGYTRSGPSAGPPRPIS